MEQPRRQSSSEASADYEHLSTVPTIYRTSMVLTDV
jgi:hypothetical protein